MSDFSKPPHAVSGLSPFTVAVSTEEIDDLNTLLKRPLPKVTWENSSNHGEDFGVTRDWLANAVSEWQKYDWQVRKVQNAMRGWDKFHSRINSVPHFTLPIQDGGEEFSVHFAALFSPNPSAFPIILPHGWPGSFLEFLPIMTKLQSTYASSPGSLPYHLIVPSLPGYVFTPAPIGHGTSNEFVASILHKLMLKLGFGEPGYIVQGGDVGAGVARSMALQYDECLGVLVNMLPLLPPANKDELAPPTATEMISLGRGAKFANGGMGYATIHGTKPSTIGLALASSPQALLAWIGEKMIAWSHEPPPLDDILANVSLYWFTGCFPSSIWIYRDFASSQSLDALWGIDGITKPLGFSHFPYEIAAPPRSWAENTGRVTFFRSHDKGGHFAALEQPDLLWQDIVEFVDHVKETRK